MKVMGGNIHEWCKQSAIKGGGCATSLHPLHHRDILGKHKAPSCVQAFTPCPIRIAYGTGIGIQKLESLPGLIYDL